MVHNAICGEEPRGSSCLFMVTSEKLLSSVCCAEPWMLGAAIGFYLPGHSQRTPIKGCGGFLVKNPWRCRWNIQTYPVTTVYSLLPVFSSVFLCLPLSPSVSLCPPSSWLRFSEHMYLLESRQCQIQILYSFFIFLICVWCAHMYMCIHMHMHTCAYMCMCVPVCACVHM